MPTQLTIQPEIAEKLLALARAKGLTVDELLREALDVWEAPHAGTNDHTLEEFERDMDALAEGLEGLPHDYHGTYTRADIYLDHD